MRKALQLATFLLFWTAVLPAQELSRGQADSLLRRLNQSIPDTSRLNALLQLAVFDIHQRRASDSILTIAAGYLQEAEQLNKQKSIPYATERIGVVRSTLYRVQGKTVEGKALLESLIARLQAKGDKGVLGSAYYELSEYYNGNFLHETMLERIRYLQLAISAYKESSRMVELARCYRLLADLHQLNNDNVAAFGEIRTALKYYDSAGYADKQGAVSLLGRIYYEQGDYKQALNYELTALKIATNSGQDNVRLLCQINNNIGFTYLKLNENQKALQYFVQALDIAKGNKENETIYLLAANVVDAYLKMNAPLNAAEFFRDINKEFSQPLVVKYEGGDFGISQTYLKIYLALKEYDKAGYYCQQVIGQAANPNINHFTLSQYYQLIASYFIQTARYDAAQSYLKKDQQLLDSVKSLSAMAQNYLLWFALDTARGRYREAIGSLIRVNEIKDSIFDETKSRQTAQLEVEFDMEKKEDEISLLNQKAILENTRLKQADFVKDVTIGGIVLLFIIAGLLYRQSSFRKKSNIVVTHKNELLQNLLKEKEWLLKEVHHRVKNNLHTVVCLLESQARYLEEDALRAIESSQHRIYAMSLIHQKLYQSDNMGTVETDAYLKELASYLAGSFGDPGHIIIELKVEELRLNLSQAIPLGLIINEGVTNAFKYAFPNRRTGKIRIELKKQDDLIKVVIADNGIGMSPVTQDFPSSSLGLDLIRGLTMDLQGECLFENDHGTRITILFHADTEAYTVDNNPI